jgi:hypothetical protein
MLAPLAVPFPRALIFRGRKFGSGPLIRKYRATSSSGREREKRPHIAV